MVCTLPYSAITEYSMWPTSVLPQGCNCWRSMQCMRTRPRHIQWNKSYGSCLTPILIGPEFVNRGLPRSLKALRMLLTLPHLTIRRTSRRIPLDDECAAVRTLSPSTHVYWMMAALTLRNVLQGPLEATTCNGFTAPIHQT